MRKWRGETNENSDTDNEDPTTTSTTTPERENTATSSTNDPENNESTTTADNQTTIANANEAVDPINGANTEVQQNTEDTVENEIQAAPSQTNEITLPTVLPEEPQGMVKRKRGRPRKDPTAPKSTIIPTPHTHNLRKSIRLPQ
jgi:hypothetical protein